MRKIFENTIFLISQIVALPFAVLWYLETKDYEPIIVTIGFITMIIISIFFKFKKQKSEGNGTSSDIIIMGNDNNVLKDINKSQININTGNKNEQEN